MGEMYEDKLTVFSGMFSLLFKAPKEGLNLRLPNIFSDENSEIEEFEKKKKTRKSSRNGTKKTPKMKVTACPHVNKRHYAKNMCNNCYHRSGRQKKAWLCSHQDRQLYAKGMCQFCYLQNYHKSRSYKTLEIEGLSI